MNAASKRPEGVLVFDLDGTLVDTSGDLVFSVNHVRRVIGLGPLSKEQVLAQVGHGAGYLLPRVTGIDQNDNERLDQLMDEFRRHYLAHQTERSNLYPGIRDALESLVERYDLYVLSNKPHVALQGEIDGQKIGRFFKGIWGGGALPALKPDPVGIDTALQESAVPRSRCVMIGDMAVDIQVGINAGVSTCFVTWGFAALGDGDPTPDVIVKSPNELEAAVRGLPGFLT